MKTLKLLAITLMLLFSAVQAEKITEKEKNKDLLVRNLEAASNEKVSFKAYFNTDTLVLKTYYHVFINPELGNQAAIIMGETIINSLEPSMVITIRTLFEVCYIKIILYNSENIFIGKALLKFKT